MNKKQKQFTYDELSSFCLSLAHLIHAGLPTGDGLDLIARDETNATRKNLFQDMARQADAGAGLACVLEKAEVFPTYVHAMLTAGEESGRVEEALFALADYYENRARLDRQLRTCLLHPLILVGVLVVVIVALLGWVLPVFNDVYRQLGTSLTGVAGGLLALGGVLRSAMPLLIPLAIVLVGLVLWLFFSRRGQEKFTAFFSRRDGMDGTRLTRILAMALNSGLGESRAMELALTLDKEGTPFHTKCKNCLALVLQGELLPRALLDCKLLSPPDCRLLEAGYRSGCADTVMTQLAGRLQERDEARLEARLGRIEPALVLASSVLVGLILLSVLLPLTRIMAAIG